MDIESHSGSNSGGLIDATTRGPICVQGVPYWRQTANATGSEDCLLLDVLVPKTPASSYLPVLVQIHGGGYDQGNSQSNPGYMMVNQSMGGMIYVSIQYVSNLHMNIFSSVVAPRADRLEHRRTMH